MIYLASTSPRRKFLLKKYGITFKTLRPDYEESNESVLGPARLVKKHALEKGLSCLRFVKNGVILSADTIVYLKKKVIGKPQDMKEALRILGGLQNRWHRVYTGVVMLQIHAGKVKKRSMFSEVTKVKLKRLSRKEIKRYFRKINPFDKAGAYAIQSKQPNIINQFKGSLTNAIGLPMETVLQKYQYLKR